MPRKNVAILWSRYTKRTKPLTTWWNLICWWEARRLVYNIIVGLSGVVGFLLFFILFRTGVPSADFEGFYLFLTHGFTILFFYGVAVNVCYTGGCIFELIVRRITNKWTDSAGSTLFKIGIWFSIFISLWVPMVLISFAFFAMF